MAEYNFTEIEKRWQQYWEEKSTYKAELNPSKPKYYILDMFPYPSGAGLHVGHPLGYIATDIVSRYKRLKGFNVLHPMGFDAFGLPAEQYAIQTGQHPAITTEQNITRYVSQLKKIGLSFDWGRAVRTSEPEYYKWTQWIFIKFFHAWYNKETNKAEHINTLIAKFAASGNKQVKAACTPTEVFTAEQWKGFTEKEQQTILLNYRLAYLADTTVNWCPGLGTVLANEEVKDGVSERGGFPVIRKEMKQWSLRITAYADRFLDDLETVVWPDPVEEMQRNWIGKSQGAEISWQLAGSNKQIHIFTTRPDTIFGASFMVLAPEHELVEEITTADKKQEVEKYVTAAKNRSERERMSDVKNVSGVFTGAYTVHPFTQKPVPVWISDYVLAGYGTGAIMAVPAHDSRDYAFAKHFGLPIVPVVEGGDIEKEAHETKEGKVINSDFLNGLQVKEAISLAVKKVEELGIGTGKTNYKMRDAIFSRQRYWGEPIPVYYKDGIPYTLKEEELPLLLPEIDEYKPTETGEPPLARAKNWCTKEGYPYEASTMPGWAGSSWYFFRYMDAHNDKAPFSKEAEKYWGPVDFYVGGSEHATGHLLYARLWNKFLYDMGYASRIEPFEKLINQGMIQGRSNFVYKLTVDWISETPNVKYPNIFISKRYYDAIRNDDFSSVKEDFDKQQNEIINKLELQYQTKIGMPVTLLEDKITVSHVDVNIVENEILDLEKFKQWRPDFANAEFILENGKYVCGVEVEKMSKRWYNVVNPDDVIDKYGADALRMYEMFLGPLEQSKPWNTNSIDGVVRFLKKLWRMYQNEAGEFYLSDEAPTKEELKTLHKTIKKVEEDIERFSLNTCVSTFMICVNELSVLKCNKKAILRDLLLLINPFAPHITKELWHQFWPGEPVSYAPFPKWNEEYLKDSEFEYPISINGKTRVKMPFATDTLVSDIEKAVLASESVQKWLEGKTPKKVIIVPNKIVNVVV